MLKIVLAICGLSVMLILHILCVLFDGKVSKILMFVNIALHIAYLAPLLFIGVTIEQLALAYMISVFVYTAAVFIKHELLAKKKGVEPSSDKEAEL